MKYGERKGEWSPCGLSELRSAYNSRWQKQLCINQGDSHEHVLKMKTDTPIFLLFIAGEVGICAAPYPLRLSVITVSLRNRHPPGGLNLLINLVLIVCTKALITS